MFTFKKFNFYLFIFYVKDSIQSKSELTHILVDTFIFDRFKHLKIFVFLEHVYIQVNTDI